MANIHQRFFSLRGSISLLWLVSWRSRSLTILSCPIAMLNDIVERLYSKSTLLKFLRNLICYSKILSFSVSLHTKLTFCIHIRLTLWILSHLKLMYFLFHTMIFLNKFLYILERYWSFLQFLVFLLKINKFRLNIFCSHSLSLKI